MHGSLPRQLQSVCSHTLLRHLRKSGCPENRCTIAGNHFPPTPSAHGARGPVSRYSDHWLGPSGPWLCCGPQEISPGKLGVPCHTLYIHHRIAPAARPVGSERPGYGPRLRLGAIGRLRACHGQNRHGSRIGLLSRKGSETRNRIVKSPDSPRSRSAPGVKLRPQLVSRELEA